MAKKKSDVVFCGLVRAPDLFKKSIGELSVLRKKGLVDKIILSTWIGEVDKYSGLREFMKKNKVIVIESKEPEVSGLGHVWNQMISLDTGLKKCSKDSFVLKTRPDVYVNPKFIEKLIKNKEKTLKIKKNLPRGNVFKYRVWVPSFELRVPFYVSDIVFYGHHSDVKKLVNFDKTYDPKNFLDREVDKLIHIRRFVHPFLKKYPFLYKDFKEKLKKPIVKTWLMKFSKKVYHLGKFPLIQRLRWEQEYRNLLRMLKDRNYLASLAAYYFIMYSHFYIDNSSFEKTIAHRQEYKKDIKIDSNNFLANFSRNRLRGRALRHIHVFDDELIKNLVESKINKDPVSEKIIEEIAKFMKS